MLNRISIWLLIQLVITYVVHNFIDYLRINVKNDARWMYIL